MAKKITISAGSVSLNAELNDSPTAQQLWDILPIQGSANIWGDEIYFDIPLHVEQEADARADVEIGELAYWPPGNAFCIFYGPTPASSGPQPRAASPVNVLGRVDGDATQFRSTQNGASVTIKRLHPSE